MPIKERKLVKYFFPNGKHPLDLLSKTCEGSMILLYLEANKLACHSLSVLREDTRFLDQKQSTFTPGIRRQHELPIRFGFLCCSHHRSSGVK